MSLPSNTTTEARAAAYDHNSALLRVLFEEVSKISAKRPDLQLTPLKVRLINRTLKFLRHHLRDEPEAEFLDVLRAQNAQASDAALLLSQYVQVLEQFNGRYRFFNLKTRKGEWKIAPPAPARKTAGGRRRT